MIDERSKNTIARFLIAAAITLISLGGTVFAKDPPTIYEVGIIVSAQTVVAQQSLVSGGGCGSAGCVTPNVTPLSHTVTTVQTPEGFYEIEQPGDGWNSFFTTINTNSKTPVDIRKKWFVDNLKEGDKLLFSASCNSGIIVNHKMVPGRGWKLCGRIQVDVARNSVES